MLGEKDKIVGVTKAVTRMTTYFPVISKLPSVGFKDYEAMLSLNPDLVCTYGSAKTDEQAKKLPSIPVVGLSLYKPKTLAEEMIKLGYIFRKEDRAKHYIDDFHNKYIDSIKAKTEGIPEDKRPKVYVESEYGSYKTWGAGSTAHQFITMAGGRNIFADLSEVSVKVDPEAIMVRNPDIIIKYLSVRMGHEVGYGTDNPLKVKEIRDEIMNRPELANVTAVKNGRVYMIDSDLIYGADYPISITYWAKWFHPELFEDLDPKAIHQEYLTEFQGFDYDLDKHGVFVYPPLED